jgi:glycosyltransferase involved in cell wall biosynthesis
MKRLLVYTENYLFGGGNRYMIDLTNAIGKSFDNIVIASNLSGIFPDDISRLEFPCTIKTVPIFTKNMMYHYWLQYMATPLRMIIWIAMLPLEPIIFIYNLVVCFSLLIKTQPSLVVSCNGGYPGSRSTLIMIISTCLCRVPSVLSVVSTPQPLKSTFSFYSRVVDWLIYSSTRIIIVNSNMIAKQLIQTRRFPNDKIIVIHNGLEDSAYIKDPDVQFSLNGKVLIGCVSRVEYAKGVTYLFDAYRSIFKDAQDSKLILAGNGDAHEMLSRKINELGLDGNVLLMGHVKAEMVEELISTFHIYVLPSLHEGFPYSILEAMRAGCAIIATNVGGIPEAISNGEDGILVEARSSEALCGALIRLLSDRVLRAQLGKKARERFLKDFKLDVMQEKLKEIFIDKELI